MKPRTRRVIVLLAALASMALTARLGVWQLSRAAQKEALRAALDGRAHLPELAPGELAVSASAAADQHYRHIRLRGEWLPQGTVFLDNRQMNGRPGFFVLTPLKLAGGDAVVVQRGWVPRDLRDRTLLPPVPTPPGAVELSGQIGPPPGRLFEFSASASGVIRQNLELPGFSRELGVALRPLSVLQLDAAGAPAGVSADGLLRQWPRPAADVHKHYGYAFQWFALCALIAGLYVWFQLLRPRFRRA